MLCTGLYITFTLMPATPIAEEGVSMATINRVRGAKNTFEVQGQCEDGFVRRRFSKARCGEAFEDEAQALYDRCRLFEKNCRRIEAGLPVEDAGPELLAQSADVKARQFGRLCYQDLADKYLDQYLKHTKAWGNRSYVHFACKKWGAWRLPLITNAQARPWLNDVLESDVYKPVSVLKVARYFVRVFNWGWECDIIDRNPVQKLIDTNLKKVFRRLITSRTTILEQEEFDKLVEDIPLWLARVAKASWYTGMRRGEVCAARFSRFDGKYLYFTAGEDKEVDEKKLICDDALIDLIHAIALERELEGITDDHIFLGANDQPLVADYVTTAWRRELDAFGRQDVWFHDVRRSYIVRKRRAGISDRVLAAQVGHHAVATTRIYDTDVSVEEMEKLSGAS
jgi:integrase